MVTSTVVPGSYSTLISSNAGTKLSSCNGSSWSFMYLYDLVEPSWSLKVTQGETTSSMTVPLCAMAAFNMACNCLLSPENERPTKVAPRVMAMAQVSIAGRSLSTPLFNFDPTSAVAENWPLVSP